VHRLLSGLDFAELLSPADYESLGIAQDKQLRLTKDYCSVPTGVSNFPRVKPLAVWLDNQGVFVFQSVFLAMLTFLV
jgi:hypothetical protein